MLFSDALYMAVSIEHHRTFFSSELLCANVYYHLVHLLVPILICWSPGICRFIRTQFSQWSSSQKRGFHGQRCAFNQTNSHRWGQSIGEELRDMRKLFACLFFVYITIKQLISPYFLFISPYFLFISPLNIGVAESTIGHSSRLPGQQLPIVMGNAWKSIDILTYLYPYCIQHTSKYINKWINKQ